MKLLKCIFSPARLEAVKQALLNEGVQGATLLEAQGYGVHKAQLFQKVSRNYIVEFQSRIMLELILPDDQVDPVIRLLSGVLRTGRLGDGKLFVLPVEDAIRLRTGEHGEAAL